jgi:UDP-glucose 4-epimerase
LLAARDHGVRRVVYASSSSVYGNTPALPKREDMPPAPMSPYAAHKLSGELLCQVFTQIYGLETVALRYFNVFGPRQNPHAAYAAVIPLFLQAFIERRRPIIFGDGEQTRDFTYIDNIVQANLQAAVAPAAVGMAINIGCTRSVSLNTILHLMGQLLNTHIEPEYREPRPGDVHDSLADIQRAQKMLGYEPAISFQEGLTRTVATLQISMA